MLKLMLWDRDHNQRVGGTIGVESGPRIATSRCNVVRAFLKTDYEWLMWFDVDMVPEPDCLDRLLEYANPTDHPIVGALCFAGGRTRITPTIYSIGTGADGKLESTTMLKYPTPALLEVGGTGSACLVIHRTVFEKIQEQQPDGFPLPWYQDVVANNQDFGEDLIFCLRARHAGARIFVHTGVKVGHRKAWVIDEEAFKAFAARLDEVKGLPEDEVLTMDDIEGAELKVGPTFEALEDELVVP